MNALASPLLTTLVKRGFVLVFFILLCAPLVVFFSTNVDEVDLHEHRRLAEFPALTSFTELPARLNNYANDHFGLRNDLITLHRFIDSDIFGISLSPDVLIGKSGWLFFLGDDSLNDMKHQAGLSSEQLACIRDVLSQRNTALLQAHVPYLFIVPPDKQAIYPEEIPPGILDPQGSSRLQEIQKALTSDPLLASRFLYLAPALLAAKKADPSHDLYFRTDTHWNLYGAGIAYRALIEKLNEIQAIENPSKPPLPVPEFPRNRFTENPVYHGDLDNMAELALPDVYVHFSLTDDDSPTRTVTKLPISTKWQAYFDSVEGWKNPYLIYNPKAPVNKTLLIVGDSFSGFLRFYLSDTFQRVVVATIQPENSFLHELVQRVHPDFVVEERVEREFSQPYQPSFANSHHTPFGPGAPLPPTPNAVLDSLVDGTWKLISGPDGKESLDQAETGLKLPILPGGDDGYLDQITLPHAAADTLVVAGWATSTLTQHPFDAVIATVGPTVIAIDRPNIDRPDVVSVIHNPAALKSGYRFTIPFELIRNPGPLRVFGVIGGPDMDQYCLQELHYGATALASPIAVQSYNLVSQKSGIAFIKP